MSPQTQLLPIFAELRQLLARYAPHLRLLADGPGEYRLGAQAPAGGPEAIAFAELRLGAADVVLDFSAARRYPELLQGLAPELSARREEGCRFAFTALPRPLRTELAELVEDGFEKYVAEQLVPLSALITPNG